MYNFVQAEAVTIACVIRKNMCCTLVDWMVADAHASHAAKRGLPKDLGPCETRAWDENENFWNSMASNAMNPAEVQAYSLAYLQRMGELVYLKCAAQ